MREVGREDGDGEDGAAGLGDRDVALPPPPIDREAEEKAVADAADVRVLHVGASVTGDARREDDRLEAGAVLVGPDSRRLVDAAPEAGGVPRLQELDNPAVLLAHVLAQDR